MASLCEVSRISSVRAELSKIVVTMSSDLSPADSPNKSLFKELEHTLLHVAASNGDTSLVAEMMILMPSLSSKLNHDGLSPLHLALEKNHLETAGQMIDLDGGLIRVPGRGRMTPMHCLVLKFSNSSNDENEAEALLDLLIIDFLWACPEAVNDVTLEHKTPLHIALASKSLDAFNVLFGWVCRTGQHSVLKKQDIDGNNLMHLTFSLIKLRYIYIVV